ncbi:MAG TPA: VCBS repeat-containing protein [Deltaproteobacteria bacterium]|nr:VCBS repeat-containing protein [Deltaproteobacteria bacterium]
MRLPIGLTSTLLLGGCVEYDLNNEPKPFEPPGECFPSEQVPERVLDPALSCPSRPPGGFDPIVEWEFQEGGLLTGCLSLPAVGDVDGDGVPDVVVNVVSGLLGTGELVVLRGNGGGVLWRVNTANLGYGAPPALADIDNDGSPEIVTVKEYQNSLLFAGDYTVVAYDAQGNVLWESEHFVGDDIDYATSVSVSDMDHDGFPEIVVGRVILTNQGQTRGVGTLGRGSYGWGLEAGVPAVTDIDLDGTEEVIVGNAVYSPDGALLWDGSEHGDGMVSPVDLDDDPEGEFIAITFNTIRAHDTNGAVLWGPLEFAAGASLSPAAVADIDNDGRPEIVFSGQNKIWALNHDGTPLWNADVTDLSGATGPSIFDFEGDGQLEVAHIDEVKVTVFDGATGAVSFLTRDHASNTMFDYPVIADVDADGDAEIIVCHNGYSSVLSVYGDVNSSWAPARKVWNQHAYGISNIEDDLSVPIEAVPSFVDTNTWHAATTPTTGELPTEDLFIELLEVCRETCPQEMIFSVRVVNRIETPILDPVSVALYVEIDGVRQLVETRLIEDRIEGGWATGALSFTLPGELADSAQRIIVAADDDGTGAGAFAECNESNNILSFELTDGCR